MEDRLTEEDLSIMTATVRRDRPSLMVVTALFDLGAQVGVAVGVTGRRRVAQRYPIKGFTVDTLRQRVEELAFRSAETPVNG